MKREIMKRLQLAILCCAAAPLAEAANHPQNPFPGRAPAPTGSGPWSSFWWADQDGDGALDALVLHPTAALRLLRNAAGGEFEDVTGASGLAGIFGASQALWVDLDGDARLDLFLTVPAGRSRVLRNVEGRTFEDVSALSGLDLAEGVLHAELLDYDQDGAPDLFLVGPERERLFRNQGAGFFEESNLSLAGRARLEAPLSPLSPQPGARVPVPRGGEEPELDPQRRPGSANGGSRSIASAPTSGPVPGPGVTGTPTGPQLPAGASLVCAGSVEDFANPGTCMNASTMPTLGMLYPISSDWFVSPIGRIGLGTTSPIDRLHVEGRVRASGQFHTTAVGMAPLVVNSDIKVALLNADRLDDLDSTELRLVADPILTADLADGAVTGVKLANSAVGTNQLANLAVTGAKIADETISFSKLADQSVHTQKIANLAVTELKLANNSVTTDKIENGAVASTKLSSGAVISTKIANDAVTSNHILDGTIVNADVSAVAAIAGTKINPNFGSQNVLTTGRVGIGTAGPNSTLHVNAPVGDDPFRIQIAGGSRFLVSDTGGVTIGAFNDNPPANGLYVAGNVGIGTATPGYPLHVVGALNASGALYQNGSVVVSATGLFFGKDTGWPELAYNLGTSGLGMGSPSANNLAFKTLGIERLRITNSGRVGIGVTSPGFRLDLPNTSNADGQGRANAWVTYSSKRWKENIEPIAGALDLVLQMRGVTFDWTAESGGQQGDIGFIAEEVGALVPQLVAWEEDGVHAKSLKYDRISALTVEAIKAQQTLVEGLQGELELVRAEQQSLLSAAELRIAELELQLARQGETIERMAAALSTLIDTK